MKLRKCTMTQDQITTLYNSGTKAAIIAQIAGISRVAVYNIIKQSGVVTGRRAVLDLKCKFCGETYSRPRSHGTDKKNAGYCSIQCFHADRSLYGKYSARGVDLYKPEYEQLRRSCTRKAREIIQLTGINLTPNQVIHHKDGNYMNNDISNLQIFNSHSEHMKHHHALRRKKLTH